MIYPFFEPLIIGAVAIFVFAIAVGELFQLFIQLVRWFQGKNE